MIPFAVCAVAILIPTSALACGDTCHVEDNGDLDCAFSFILVDCINLDEDDCIVVSCSDARTALLRPASSLSPLQCSLKSASAPSRGSEELVAQFSATRLRART
jgi:hypothetical protein